MSTSWPQSLGVIYGSADQLGRSVGDMHRGAWGPAIIQVLLFALHTFVLSRLRPQDVPRSLGGIILNRAVERAQVCGCGVRRQGARRPQDHPLQRRATKSAQPAVVQLGA